MFFVGGVHSDMLLYYKRGEVSMGLLYCGANIQPTVAAEVCDDGRCTPTARGSRGGIFRTLNAVFFRGIISDLACLEGYSGLERFLNFCDIWPLLSPCYGLFDPLREGWVIS